MTFCSIDYVLFFVLAFVLTRIFCLNTPFFILIVSLAFYAINNFQSSFFLIGYVLLNYIIYRKSGKGKVSLLVAWIFNLSTLIGFKYVFVGHGSYIPLIGLSFLILRTMSLMIDTHRGVYSSEANFTTYAAYISFFPLLNMGPVERASKLLPQLQSPAPFQYELAVKGIQIMLVGFFMKIVLANRIGYMINPVFEHLSDYNMTTSLVVFPLYAFQLYYDFAGYSYIAIGSAKVLGYDVSGNFNMPFFAKNMTDFWQRWHISVGSWFRDYIYVPCYMFLKKLGAFWSVQKAHLVAIFISFMLLGLWHNVTWNFVLAAIVQFAFLGIELFYKPSTKKIAGLVLSRLYVFVVFSFTIIFFHLPIEDIQIFFNRSFTAQFNGLSFLDTDDFNIEFCLATLVCIVIAFFIEALHFQKNRLVEVNEWGKIPRWIFYFIITLAFLGLGVFNDSQKFVYEQF